MANTRFFYDDCRTIKQLQQSTDVGRWILNVPGFGDKPYYIEDPQIRIQTWGANLMTNSIDLESQLLGINRPLGKDCTIENNFRNPQFQSNSQPIQYQHNSSLFVEDTRATCPAWTFRDKEQVDWYYPPLDPQENTCFSFQNNVSTRILEKDYFKPVLPSRQDTNVFPVSMQNEEKIKKNEQSVIKKTSGFVNPNFNR
jgi:hypothetical protein